MQFVSYVAPPEKRRKLAYTETVQFRKLLIAPIMPSMKLSTVVQYFENFGEIEDIQICSQQCFGYGTVQFKLAESTRDVLQKRYHRIAKHIVSVQPANDQPIGSDLNRVFRAAPAQLSDLDDECLMIIAEHLDKFGLCALAKTSIRLKRIAEQFFSNSKEFDKFELYPNLWPYFQRTYAAHKALFLAFSHLIKKLDATCHGDGQSNQCENSIEYLTRYPCDSLKYLELSLEHSENGVVLDNTTKEKLKQLFSRLNHLKFSNDNYLDSQTTKELLSSCSELESISVYSTEMCKNIYFPKLQKLELVRCEFERDEFETMLAFNRGIRKLKFFHTEVPPEILTIITRYLPNLEKMSILQELVDHINFDDLRKLKHLKSLKIDDGTLPASALDGICEANIPIESLFLQGFDDDQDAKMYLILDKVLTMKSLKKLKLSIMNFGDKHLEKLAKELPCLSKLSLTFIDMVTINGLKNMLLHAKNLMFLDFNDLLHIKKGDKCRLHAFIDQHCGGRDIKINII